MPKRKSLSTGPLTPAFEIAPIPIPRFETTSAPPPAKKRASGRKASRSAPTIGSTNPNENANVLDAPEALRASPDACEAGETMNLVAAGMDVEKQVKKEEDDEESPLSDIESPAKQKKAATKGKAEKAKGKEAKTEPAAKAVPTAKPKDNTKDIHFLDPEAKDEEEADEEELQAALSRPPPVNSDYLPLPWKGRLGYACLNTYLRFSNPPVFNSRTCRIASILENRHPLQDPNAPPHATKNRPDREKPADVARGQVFVESLGIANAKDIVKMLRWNDRFGIKFLRLSSEMFPFASHPEYGYKLAPFVSRELAEAGKVAAELGHRLTTHPGQFTQLGSPRKAVIDNAIRDLDYHTELLSLLNLPAQQDRDAIMVLHLGGVFGDKAATLDRFRENYAKLPQGVKDRLVLENDDVSWSVHDLLPFCEELNIPMVLDFHHHNIIFDGDKIREGTKDIVNLFPRILATWKRKNITPKMHYSEPTPSAITGRQRRKHNPRVATLPPCPPDMDLMIEAKDKEQAVFELMRTFKLPGHDNFNDIIPHVRKDDNKPVKIPANKKKKMSKKKSKTEEDDDDEGDPAVAETLQEVIADDDIGMGGPEGRVYWPPGMEHWLRPQKRVVKPKESKPESGSSTKMTPAMKAAATKAVSKKGRVKAEGVEGEEKEGEEGGVVDTAAAAPDDVGDEPPVTPATKKARAALDAKPMAKAKSSARMKAAPKVAAEKGEKGEKRWKKSARSVPTPSTSEEEDGEGGVKSDFEGKIDGAAVKRSKPAGRRQSGRGKKVSYAEDEDGDED